MSKKLHMTVDANNIEDAMHIFTETAAQHGWRILTVDTVKRTPAGRFQVRAYAEKINASKA